MTNEKIFKAVETSNITEVEKALSEEKINAATYYGAKSIVLAAEQGNSEILKMLLKSGEKINRESFWRRTAFSALRAAQNTGNNEILELLLEYGAGDEDKKILDRALNSNTRKSANINKTKFCNENDISVPEKSSKDNTLIQCAREGKIGRIRNLLEEEVSEKAILAAVDAALENNHWKTAQVLAECKDYMEIDVYTEYLKKLFIKASYTGDVEKTKNYLEALIENAVGVLTNETGKSTLEIALENPSDLIQILSNYGFHENSLLHAYKCLINN